MRDEMLSGDSGLQSVWEEVCAQIQGEESADWWAYEDLIQTIALTQIEQLCHNGQLALWTQTSVGWNWVYDHFSDEGGASVAPLELSPVVKLIEDEVLSAASDYASPALSRFLFGRDKDEDDESQ